jgi:superfamily II DNA or RNA helicase
MNTVYPIIEDPQFQEKINHMEDFKIFKSDPIEPVLSREAFENRSKTLCQFEKTSYQHLVSQYISQRTPYRSLLLYHGLGSGKSCSAITIAETFLTNQRLYDEPFVWIISKKALKKSFEKEVFQNILLLTPEFLRDQCTRDTYYQMIPDYKSLSNDKISQRILKIIKSRYKFFGYEKFANTIESYMEAGILEEKIKNKVIIIDEAHNIRNLESSGETQKKIIEPFLNFIKYGENNRLVLLSATPMFNEPDEILWLLSLLTLNDKKSHLLSPYKLPSLYNSNGKANQKVFDLVAKLSSYYISYVKGNNPFTFAARISPRQLNMNVLENTPSITFQGETIKEKWLAYIRDGLVPSPLQGIQLQNMNELLEDKTKLSTALLRQLNNITYVKQLGKEVTEFVEGKEGIYSIFKKKTESLPIQLEYINPKEPILNPHYGKLQDYAAKLYTISQLLQKSQGPIVIYSNFIWGGLVPLAIMLEHMGFSRYGENDLLFMSQKVTGTYPFKNAKYCILSGENEKDIMGNTKIDKLLEAINTTQDIKVILMSPVASEGLTFKNIREMHILDPWYHLNTIEQAVGRGIRNCSHASLPLEERNVSIFLHTTVFPKNDRETEDLHAYRLAAIKQSQINAVDKIIKENALDCSLLQTINYIPKDLFQFRTTIKTSHGTNIPYEFGDDKEVQITCAHTGKAPRDTRAFREESYSSYIPTLQQKLRKLLKENYEKQNKSFYNYDELRELIHENKDVAHSTIERSLYPYKLWGNYGLMYHMQQFIIVDFTETKMRPTRLQLEDTKEIIQPLECNLETIFETFALDPEQSATIKLYQSLDSQCWKLFAEKLITQPESISPRINPIIAILEKQGALIKTATKYTGYVNIFSAEDAYEVILYDQGTFREATPTELSRLIKEKTHVPYPDPSKIKIINTIGLIQRYKNAKDPNSPYRFQLKLGLNNEKVKRSGIVCDTGLKKPEVEKELAQFSGKKGKMNISQMCFSLMTELFNVNRLWIPPIYKPK